jgi:CBS domain containing-hemolysin-like protein
VARLAEKGQRLARVLRGILRDQRQQDRYIATTQLGVTLASLGLGMYGEHTLARGLTPWFAGLGSADAQWFTAHAVASTIAVLLFTVLHVVLGEMVPKSLALASPRRAAFLTLPITLTTRFLFFPLVRGLEWSSNRILRLMGIDRSAASVSQYHTEQDLLQIVEESRKGGKLRTEAGKVLMDLLEFGSLKASAVMVPRVSLLGVELGSTAADLAKILSQVPHTRYPVYRDSLDQIQGMVHIKDLITLVRDGRALHEDMVRPIPFVPENMGVNRVLGVMRRDRTHIVVVMDEQGGTAGLLTMKDLFDEVVGPIEEAHHKDPRPEIYLDPRGQLRVAGTVRLDELSEAVDHELPQSDAETVSGLVLLHLGRPATVGDVVTHGHLRLLVVTVEGRGVKECMVLEA